MCYKILRLTLLFLTLAIGQAWACHTWPPAGQTYPYAENLNNAVSDYNCVQINSGTFVIDYYVEIPDGHTLKGTSRDSSILKAGPYYNWRSQLTTPLVSHSGSGNRATISDFTIDGDGKALIGVASRQFTVSNMRIRNCACSGVTINGYNTTVTNSIIEYNGSNCPVSPPGGGIYGVLYNNGYSLNPVITYNTIVNNTGPAVDMDRVWGGTLTNNTIGSATGSGAWAAVSLFGASYWTVSGNQIYNSGEQGCGNYQYYHPTCCGGPIGAGHAGLMICGNTDVYAPAYSNYVNNNRMAGRYGILLIGSTGADPYNNTIQNSDVSGSNYGCADDAAPGVNSWSNNNCAGTPNTPPGYF